MPQVKAVAERTGRNVGQVLVRWALQRRPDCSVGRCRLTLGWPQVDSRLTLV